MARLSDGEAVVLVIEVDNISDVGFGVFAGGEPDLGVVGMVEEIGKFFEGEEAGHIVLNVVRLGIGCVGGVGNANGACDIFADVVADNGAADDGRAGAVVEIINEIDRGTDGVVLVRAVGWEEGLGFSDGDEGVEVGDIFRDLLMAGEKAIVAGVDVSADAGGVGVGKTRMSERTRVIVGVLIFLLPFVAK